MRSKFFKCLLITFLLLSFTAVYYLGASDEERITLPMLVWVGYTEDEWIVPFEEQHGVEIAPTYVGSNDEMFAKMKAGAGAVWESDGTTRGPLHWFQSGGTPHHLGLLGG